MGGYKYSIYKNLIESPDPDGIQEMLKIAVIVLALSSHLDAKPARRSVSCGLVGFSCDQLPIANSAFCCDPPADAFTTQNFVSCDPFTNTISRSACTGNEICVDEANGEALCHE